MNYAIAFLMIFISRCAVEVGNPVDETSGGTVKVSLVANQESSLNLVSSNKRLELHLDYIVLLGTDGQNSIQAELTPLQSQIDLYQAQAEILVAADTVPIGEYQQLVLVLTEERPLGYYDDDGDELELDFQDSENYAIYINHDVVVTNQDDSLILLDFDLTNSVVTEDGRSIFRPKLRSFHKDRIADYAGTLDRNNGIVVCAYRYHDLDDDDERSLSSHGKLTAGRGEKFSLKKGKRPPPGEQAEHPEEFEHKSDLVLDTNAQCPNAFAKTRVQDDGTYEFARLKSGYYLFRAFYEDSTYTDEAEDIKL